jgi:hypothetical protein
MKLAVWKSKPAAHSAGVVFVLTLLFTVFWNGSATAKEIYKWTDEDGVVHFVDTPPANDSGQVVNIENASSPGTAGANLQNEEIGSRSAPPAASGDPEAPKSAAQQRREQIAKNRKERREAQAEMDRMCQKHRKRVEQMEPARRVFYRDEKGEEIRMDDNLRIGLIEESKEYIAKNCR